MENTVNILEGEKEKGSGEIFIPFKNIPEDPHCLSSDEILSIYEDRSGILWIGTYGGGLNKINKNMMKFNHYWPKPYPPVSPKHKMVNSIFEDQSGILLIGTGKGIISLKRKTGEFTQFKNFPNNLNSLSDDYITSIYEDSYGTLWIGTWNSGLNRFNRKKGTFTRFGIKSGLPNNVIFGILEDQNGNLWISTNSGLSKLNPQTEKFRNYFSSDGLQSDEFRLGAYFKSKSGEMFLGGINGINAF